MLFGKSAEEYNKAEQEEILAKSHGVERFAYLPVRLTNGRYVWWQKYFAYYHAGRDSHNQLFLWSSSPDTYSPYYKAYLERDEAHVQITNPIRIPSP